MQSLPAAEYTTKIFNPRTSKNANIIIAQIISIEREAFGDKAFTEKQILNDFYKDENTIILLFATSNDALIGFTYAKPSDEEHSSDPAHTRTAFIWDTAIHTDFRGRGLSTLLIETMDSELQHREYTHVEREASTKNGYVTHISTHYGNHIEIESVPHNSRYGEQVFFRIRL